MTDIVNRLLTENTMHGYYDSPAIQSEAAKEIIKLRKALEPFAQMYLWPDDRGEDMAQHIRSDVDWCEEANEDADNVVFIKRKYIRIARKALESGR